MKKELKKTNYVVVVYYDNEEYLEDCCLLGWDGREDYYCTNFYGSDIITSKNNIKKNDCGIINTSTYCCVCVGETYEDCKDDCDMGNREDLECVVCKLEKDTDDKWKVIPIV
jgi:hypothetical protein